MGEDTEMEDGNVSAEPPSTPPMPTIELDTPDRPRPQRTPSTPVYSTPVRSAAMRSILAASSGSSSASSTRRIRRTRVSAPASASASRNRTPSSVAASTPPGSAIIQGNHAVLVESSPTHGLTRVPWLPCGNCQRALSGPGRITAKYRVGCQQGGCQSGIVRCPGEPGQGGCKHAPTTKSVPDAPECSVCRGLGVVVHGACRGGRELVERCDGDAAHGPHHEPWLDVSGGRATGAATDPKHDFEIWEDPEEREMEGGKGHKKAKRSVDDDGEVFDN